jgi:electron transport complex protein RnfE
MSNNSAQLYKNAVMEGLWTKIPVFRLMLGLCPTLAVTTGVKSALTMGLSVIFVLVCSNFVVSLLRNLIKPHLRILIFTLAIAAFVTIADLYLKAFMPVMSEKLGAYIPLIIVNCIIICRAEECASKCSIGVSIVDGFFMGLGFTIVVCILGAIREIISAGTVYGIKVTPASYIPMVSLAMPVGAFVTLGLLLGLWNTIEMKKGK